MAHVVARTGGPGDAEWAALRERVLRHAARPLTAAEEWHFCEAALTRVSRTFAVNIRVLPADLRRAVLLAYLFCRVVDTVEDDAALPQLLGQPEQRVDRGDVDRNRAKRRNSRQSTSRTAA